MNKLHKLILHIGVHKTGTTAIQTFLFDNREALVKQGFFVPAFLYGAENKATAIRTSLIKKREAATRTYLAEVVKRAQNLSCDTVILSDEDYCKTNEHDLQQVRIFGEFFEEITVLMYVRRPDRQSESGFAFCVMWKGSKYSQSPEQWYRDNPGNDYYRHAMFYKTRIEGCRVQVVSYDFNMHRLIDSFIEACGIEIWAYLPPGKSASNISANKYMVEVMNAINQYALSDRLFLKIRDEVVSHPQLQAGPKAIFFTAEQRRLNQARIEEKTKQFVDEFHSGQPLFDAWKPIQVPQGLDSQVKKAIIDEIVAKYRLQSRGRKGGKQTFMGWLKQIARRLEG